MNAPLHKTALVTGAARDTAPIHVTRFTSVEPERITKTMRLDADDALVKDTPPQMWHGRADVLSLDGIRGFAALLPTLEPSQALCYGRPKADGDEFEVFSRKTLPEGATACQITRTKDAFAWPVGPGVLMLDYDPRAGGPALTREELLTALEEAVPALADVTRVWYPSASSCIYHGKRELAGVKGQRVYLAVKDARDIERAGRVIVERLWLAGHGWYEVSKSGALLERTLIDASVWQTNRLDFAAGASCVSPLEQRRGVPQVIPGAVDLLDTREHLPDLTAEERAAFEGIQRQARTDIAGEAERVRQGYVAEMANKIAAGDPERFAGARVTADQAVRDQRLMGDFPLVLDDGTCVTVGAVMDDRTKYHGWRTLDPLEPDYDGGRVVGKLYLLGGRPKLHSFAHGGRTFTLVRAPRRVEVEPGRMSDLVDCVAKMLRDEPDIFDLGDSVCTVEDGRVTVLSEVGLAYTVGHALQFYRRTGTNGDRTTDIYPPQQLLQMLIERGSLRNFKRLDAVVTAPTIRPDGTVLDQPGYDPRTRLFFDPCRRAVPAVPERPTDTQVTAALDRLMHPFKDFPFAGPLDRSVLLAAVLTAAIRPAVPTAPGFAFDAPTQGSGKTLLARCIGILACGAEPSVWPNVTQRDAEGEIRKRLMAALLKGDSAMVWDNVMGVFDSASLAAFLTGPTFSDRILGQTSHATLPNRAMFIATGNNIRLAGDLPRRFLTCRIDPQMDKPFARRFDIDPAAYCLENRQQMIVDALTVVRGWLTSVDCELVGVSADGALASFEQWDALVRQPVAWLARTDPERWCDPMDSIALAAEADPEAEQLYALLAALHREFGDKAFTSADVKKRVATSAMVDDDDEDSLAAAVADFVGPGASAKSIGRVLMNRKDRRAGGLVLAQAARDTMKNVNRWTVRRTE